MQRSLIGFIGLLASGLWSTAAQADQLQCNSQAVAKRAAKQLPTGSIFLDFCSLCEARVLIIRVKAARVVQGCEFELEVEGELVASSKVAFQEGYDPARGEFELQRVPYKERIDLAYAYVEAADNDFQWLGGQLGLSAQVTTPSIQLPAALYKSLGTHARATPASDAPAPPSPPSKSAVAQVYDYFRRGDAPVLGHLTPCLEVDLKKKSPSRYECQTPVRGPVTMGTEVFVWTDWLVPRGRRFEAEIQIWKDDEIRLKRAVPLNGRTNPIVPATVRAKLSQSGIYVFRVYLAGTLLSEASIEVR